MTCDIQIQRSSFKKEKNTFNRELIAERISSLIDLQSSISASDSSIISFI